MTIAYVTKLTDSNYKEFVNEGLTLVDIWAEWCGPCRMISPIVDEISSDYQGTLKVGKLNADENAETVGSLGIRNIPTLLLFKDGTQVGKHVGMATKDQLKELIDQNI